MRNVYFIYKGELQMVFLYLLVGFLSGICLLLFWMLQSQRKATKILLRETEKLHCGMTEAYKLLDNDKHRLNDAFDCLCHQNEQLQLHEQRLRNLERREVEKN